MRASPAARGGGGWELGPGEDAASSQRSSAWGETGGAAGGARRGARLDGGDFRAAAPPARACVPGSARGGLFGAGLGRAPPGPRARAWRGGGPRVQLSALPALRLEGQTLKPPGRRSWTLPGSAEEAAAARGAPDVLLGSASSPGRGTLGPRPGGAENSAALPASGGQSCMWSFSVYSSGLCLLKARPQPQAFPQPSMGPEGGGWVRRGKSLGGGCWAAGCRAAGRWGQVGGTSASGGEAWLPARPTASPCTSPEHRELSAQAPSGLEGAKRTPQ